MFHLPLPEMIIFVSVVFVYLTAAITGILQLSASGEKFKRILMPLVSLGICLEAVFLIVRAVEIKAVPLTGLFESMIVLTIVFGLIYLFLSIAVQQVWFGSVMVWLIFALILTAAIVAKPAAELQDIARTPWAIAHGITMILGGASIIFASASSFLYLLGNRRLKQKKVAQVLGRVPNIEKLERMILLGVRTSFVLVTTGIISGFGLVCVVGTGIAGWLTDIKVICIFAAWILLGTILILNRTLSLTGRTRAYLTILVFVLISIAIIGVTISGATQHNFSSY